MNKKILVILIFTLWVAIIAGFIGFKHYTRATGTKILLKTVPVDPRDILRGDYLVLAYDIGLLNLKHVPADRDTFTAGDTLYLLLSRKGSYGVPQAIRKSRPEPGTLFIKGVVREVLHHEITVDYGVEDYFVPEGQGRELEKYRGKGLDAEISVDKFGNAVINKLYLNGTEVTFP